VQDWTLRISKLDCVCTIVLRTHIWTSPGEHISSPTWLETKTGSGLGGRRIGPYLEQPKTIDGTLGMACNWSVRGTCLKQCLYALSALTKYEAMTDTHTRIRIILVWSCDPFQIQMNCMLSVLSPFKISCTRLVPSEFWFEPLWFMQPFSMFRFCFSTSCRCRIENIMPCRLKFELRNCCGMLG